jgi:hypothetical protein
MPRQAALSLPLTASVSDKNAVSSIIKDGSFVSFT